MATQVATPLAGASQTWLQLPQFKALWLVSTHTVPHFEKPSTQAKSQIEALHDALPWAGLGQATPHAPQLLADVARFKHAPEQLLSAPSQPALQTPAEHTSPGAQTVPHVPQLCGSVDVSRH